MNGLDEENKNVIANEEHTHEDETSYLTHSHKGGNNVHSHDDILDDDPAIEERERQESLAEEEDAEWKRLNE